MEKMQVGFLRNLSKSELIRENGRKSVAKEPFPMCPTVAVLFFFSFILSPSPLEHVKKDGFSCVKVNYSRVTSKMEREAAVSC